jgi:hypothetical protein
MRVTSSSASSPNGDLEIIQAAIHQAVNPAVEHQRLPPAPGPQHSLGARPASLSAAFTFSRNRAKAQARQINAAHARGCVKTCTDQGMPGFFSQRDHRTRYPSSVGMHSSSYRWSENPGAAGKVSIALAWSGTDNHDIVMAARHEEPLH